MLFERMFALRRSDIVRFSDLDSFRPLEFASGAKSLPLDPKNFSSVHATVHLPACQIVMQRSFPRILDASYQATGMLLGIPLDPHVQLLANGTEIDARTILAVSGNAGGKIVEPKAQSVCADPPGAGNQRSRMVRPTRRSSPVQFARGRNGECPGYAFHNH